MVNLCIFDLDGVLVDSQSQMWSPNQKKVLKSMGYEPSEEIIHSIIGGGIETNRKRFTDFYGPDFDYDLFMKLTYEANAKSIKNKEVPLKKGAKEILEYCKYQNIPMTLGSSSEKEYVHSLLKSCDIYKYFDNVVTGGDVKETKPHPDIYLKCLSYYDIPSSEAIILEDAHFGIMAANGANTRVILIPDIGDLYDEDYKHAYRHVDNLLEAIDILKQENERTTSI